MGRPPKKQATTSLYTKTPSSKSIYELIHGTKLTIQIVKNNVIGVDEKGERRYMLYSPYATSIWKDKQTDGVTQVEPVIIEGELVVGNSTASDHMLCEFLDRHPDNGRIFRKRDIGGIADSQIEEEEFVDEVRAKIKSMLLDPKTEESVRAVGRAFGFDEAEYAETKFLKQRLYEYIKVDPYRHARKVAERFDDPVSKALSDIKVAHDMGQLIYKGNSVKWSGDSGVLAVIPSGKNWKEHFAEFINSPEGFDIKQELERIVSNR